MYWHHVVNSNFQGAEYFICFSFKSPLFRAISGVLSSEKSGAGNETKYALISINMKDLPATVQSEVYQTVYEFYLIMGRTQTGKVSKKVQ